MWIRNRERSGLIRHMMVALVLLLAFKGGAGVVEVPNRPGNFVVDPFQPGFSVLEQGATWFYGLPSSLPEAGPMAYFPSNAVRGNVSIPVLLVDWSDFDPQSDLSNHHNPGSFFPEYTKSTASELDQHLNGPGGVADYFRVISGGQLRVDFHVFPWIESSFSHYLQSRNESYYYYDETAELWVIDLQSLTQDVLRSAVADHSLDLTEFDADGDQVLDGFVMVYEGHASLLGGTQMTMTNGGRVGEPFFSPSFDNVADLVADDAVASDPFNRQTLLYNRYVVLPEMGASGQGRPSVLLDHATWVHEMGHLLLGYRDYYLGGTDLGVYALSAQSGLNSPFQASAMEKWLFGGWIDARSIQQDQGVRLTNHHVRLGEAYHLLNDYLVRVPVRNDPYHFLLFEAREFALDDLNEIRFGRDENAVPPESGVIVFEVNRHLGGSDQIRRLLPERVGSRLPNHRIGAFQPGDRLVFQSEGFSVVAKDFEVEGDGGMSFGLRFPDNLRIGRGLDGLELRYEVWSGYDHVIEGSEGLSDDRWESVIDESPNSGRVSIPLNSSASHRYFRLRRELRE